MCFRRNSSTHAIASTSKCDVDEVRLQQQEKGLHPIARAMQPKLLQSIAYIGRNMTWLGIECFNFMQMSLAYKCIMDPVWVPLFKEPCGGQATINNRPLLNY